MFSYCCEGLNKFCYIREPQPDNPRPVKNNASPVQTSKKTAIIK